MVITLACAVAFLAQLVSSDVATPRTSTGSGKVYEAHVVGLFAATSELPIYHNLIKPTLDMAAEEAERRFPQIKMKVSVRLGQRTCERNLAGALAAEEFYLRKVDAVIGPVCSSALDSVARLASAWNVPVFTAGGIGSEFAAKHLYSTLTRLSFSLGSIAPLVPFLPDACFPQIASATS